jgi:hypothetical protein
LRESPVPRPRTRAEEIRRAEAASAEIHEPQRGGKARVLAHAFHPRIELDPLEREDASFRALLHESIAVVEIPEFRVHGHHDTDESGEEWTGVELP